MRPPKYSADTLVKLLQRQTVATMPQVMDALGTGSRRTAVRKLHAIPHHTSYSHNGRFYVLAKRPRFDAHGLWSFRGVRFSARGSLLDTLAALVSQAPDGFRLEELDALLQVRTGDALRRPAAAGLQTFARALDERQRRWFAGLESLRRGHGGDRGAAALLGMDPATVARGRRELAAGETLPGRVRHRLEKKPRIVPVLKELLQNDTAGDPIHGHRWCRRSTANLSRALHAAGCARWAFPCGSIKR